MCYRWINTLSVKLSNENISFENVYNIKKVLNILFKISN